MTINKEPNKPVHIMVTGGAAVMPQAYGFFEFLLLCQRRVGTVYWGLLFSGSLFSFRCHQHESLGSTSEPETQKTSKTEFWETACFGSKFSQIIVHPGGAFGKILVNPKPKPKSGFWNHSVNTVNTDSYMLFL